MTERNDGTAYCDGCGKELANTSGICCVMIGGWLAGSLEAVYLHLCTYGDDPCTTRVLTTDAIPHYVGEHGTVPSWYLPPAPIEETSDEHDPAPDITS